MALFYTDKDSENRLTPKVNTHDVHLQKTLSTDSIAPRAAGTQGGARITTSNDQVSVYDDSNLRIIIGRLPNGSFGVAISKTGTDVLEAFS